MGIKKGFIKRFITENNPQRKKSFRPSKARILIKNEKEGILLSEIKDLSTVTHLKGIGMWSEEDFDQLKQKLKAGLSKMSANVSIQEVDLGKVILSEETSALSFKELFCYCVNISKVILPDATGYKGSVDFHATFKGCSKLKQLYNFETYRSISDLRTTFYYCNLLTEIKIFASPLPKGNEDTFQKISHDLRVTFLQGATIPSVWSQIKPKNIVFQSQL